jgi:hypothetical protein
MISPKTTVRCPFKGSVGCDSFVKFSTDDSNSVWNIITEFVKVESPKIMLRGTKE